MQLPVNSNSYSSSIHSRSDSTRSDRSQNSEISKNSSINDKSKGKSRSDTQNSNLPDHICPTENPVKHPSAVSAAANIAYKREQIDLKEIYLFRVHKLVNSSKIDSDLEKCKVPFLFELFWSEDNADRISERHYLGTPKIPPPQRVSQRVVTIEWNGKTGTHSYGVCTFEYGYTAALDFICHGSLTAIHPPQKAFLQSLVTDQNIVLPRLEDILFTGMGGKMGSIENISSMGRPQLISLANTSHVKIITILNAAYELLSTIDSTVEKTKTQNKNNKSPDRTDQNRPKKEEKSEKIAIDFKEKIDSVSSCSTISEAIDQINLNLAAVCSKLLERWTKCQTKWALSEKIYDTYKQAYFKTKLERYNHGTYILKNVVNPDNLQASNRVFDREAIFNKMAITLKESTFFNEMPVLNISCQEIDISHKNHVILIEDRYKLESTVKKEEYEAILNKNKSNAANANQVTEDAQGNGTESKSTFSPNHPDTQPDNMVNLKQQMISEQKLGLNVAYLNSTSGGKNDQMAVIDDEILTHLDDNASNMPATPGKGVTSQCLGFQNKKNVSNNVKAVHLLNYKPIFGVGVIFWTTF